MTSRNPPPRAGHAAPGGLPAGRGASMSDEEIVGLWRAHRRWVAAVLHAHKPRDVDLEDLLQDVAVKLVRNIHTLDDRDSIRPWLRTVAINAARSAGRRTRTRHNAHEIIRHEHATAANGTLDGASTGHAFESLTSNDSAGARGRRALELLDSLPPHYREPLMLSLRGLSQKQIAETMEIPITTVETRLIRARRMIRDELMAEETATSAAGNSRDLPRESTSVSTSDSPASSSSTEVKTS